MVETITPAVCGSRRRQLGALAPFAGARSSPPPRSGRRRPRRSGNRRRSGPRRRARPSRYSERSGRRRPPPADPAVEAPGAGALALGASAPVWSAGYGAGLGLGVLTYQPVATFWVACAAALALGRPVAGAVAFALYGVGRAAVLLLPARRGADPAAIAEHLVARRRTLLRANAIALGACACLLAALPVAEAGVTPLGLGSQMDPPAAASGFAANAQRQGATTQGSSCDVRRAGRPWSSPTRVTVPGRPTARLSGCARHPRASVAHRGRDPAVQRPSGETRARGPVARLPEVPWPRSRARTQPSPGVRGTSATRCTSTTSWSATGSGSRAVLTASRSAVRRRRGRPDRLACRGRARIADRPLPNRVADLGTDLFKTERWLLSNPALTRERIIWTRDLPGGSTSLPAA